jgi:hypothetical protein
MIIRLEFNPSTDLLELYKFYKNPKGTCLSSSSAYNITPKNSNNYISFWFIDDETLETHFGKKVCIHALTTYPNIISVKIIESNEKITYDMILYKFAEIEQLLK